MLTICGFELAAEVAGDRVRAHRQLAQVRRALDLQSGGARTSKSSSLPRKVRWVSVAQVDLLSREPAAVAKLRQRVDDRAARPAEQALDRPRAQPRPAARGSAPRRPRACRARPACAEATPSDRDSSARRRRAPACHSSNQASSISTAPTNWSRLALVPPQRNSQPSRPTIAISSAERVPGCRPQAARSGWKTLTTAGGAPAARPVVAGARRTPRSRARRAAARPDRARRSAGRRSPPRLASARAPGGRRRRFGRG